MPRSSLLRLTPLRPSGRWNRLAPKSDHGREMRREQTELDAARLAERLARTYGCEYGQVYLRTLFLAQGCDLCGLYHPPSVLHHTRSRARLGLAEDQVVLGRSCHDTGHSKGWEALERKHDRDLLAIAAEHAAAGLTGGWLPVECCALCAANGDWKKAWHSARYMLDQISTDGPVLRVCQWCAPEGPP